MLLLALFAVQAPVLVLRPGPALPVAEQVEFVAEPEDELTGELLLTSVTISRPTLAAAAAAWLSGDKLVARDRVIPEGVNAERYFEAQREVYVEAGQVAVAAGLAAAGADVEVSGAGAEVLAVAEDAPAAGTLVVGDVVTAVDGEPVQLASDLVAALAGRGAGRTVELTVRRNDRTEQVQVELGPIGGGAVGLGVAVNTVDRSFELPFDVDLASVEIGGPSAGLMLALAVYDLADDEDLAGERIVAGTGTIDPEGRVGPVGGIEQKVAGAIEAGAEVFLVPAGEVAQARAAAGDEIPVVPVGTIDEAIEALTSDA